MTLIAPRPFHYVHERTFVCTHADVDRSDVADNKGKIQISNLSKSFCGCYRQAPKIRNIFFLLSLRSLLYLMSFFVLQGFFIYRGVVENINS